LPYHQELIDISQWLSEKKHDKYPCENFFDNLHLPDYDLYVKGDFTTMSYLKHLAEVSVQQTFSEFRDVKEKYPDLSLEQMREKVHPHCDKILKVILWNMNENSDAHKKPLTSSAFTRFTKLMLLSNAGTEEGLEFLRFFIYQNPSWHFRRSEYDDRKGRKEIDFFMDVSTCLPSSPPSLSHSLSHIRRLLKT
jgi:hypothetical protein